MPATYDLKRRLETLQKIDSWDEEISLLYEWVKTGVINKREFIFLIKEIG